MNNIWTKIYGSTGFTALSHLLLGLICLDSTIHTFARCTAGLTLTLTHATFMYLKVKKEAQVSITVPDDYLDSIEKAKEFHQSNCEHDFPYHSVTDHCRKCGKLGKMG